MFFSDILDVHNCHAPNRSLSDVLGDGFLMQSNAVYRRVRSLSVEIGCVYVEASPRYLLLPFHDLPRIVETKEIPYVPSARLMKEIELSRPNTFMTEEMPMPESHHLHESAHVIAEHFFREVPLKGVQEQILKIILGESFANTVDALACMPATDEMHRFFIRQNGYMHPQQKIMRAMTRLTRNMGFRFTFMLTFFTYVHANFLVGAMSEKSIRRLANQYAPQAKLSDKDLKDSQVVCGIGEKLDLRFRLATTGNYLKLRGFHGEVQHLLNFSFYKVFAGNKGFQKTIEALSDVVDGF
jgi:hypothetical protein